MHLQLKGHEAFAEVLVSLEVRDLFGLVGDANLFLVQSFQDRGGCFVPATHEAAAVGMADGYARATGELGVATVTHGPGLTNTVTAIIEGVRHRTPMLILAGQTTATATNHLQRIDSRAVLEPTGAGIEWIDSPDRVAAGIARAAGRSRIERRPIGVLYPADLMWSEAFSAVEQETQPVMRPELSDAALDAALGLIASMRRPLILIGRGGLAAACLDAAADLSNVLGAPTATTVLAKGALGSHPHNIGLFGSLATDAGINAISAADGVIAIGASLNEYTTDHGALLDGKRVVQVDDDLAAFGRYVDVDAQVHADAGEVVPIICRALREAGHASSGFAARNHSRGMTAENSSVPRRVFDAIEAALPADHYLVFGAGRLAVQAMGALNTSAPGAITHTMNFGSIGLATATAIGASIAAPHRRTFAVVGDGGFVLGGLVELTSAVRQDASLTVLLLNDNCYGAEQVQLQNRGLDSTLSLMPWPELAEVARALGCAAIRVDAAGDLLPLVDAVRTTRRGPLLIEIAFDPFTIPSRR